jgi:hypothetical protein
MGMSLPAKALVPQPDLLTLKSVEPAEAGWVVAVDGPDEGTCLACGQKSRSRHSRYERSSARKTWGELAKEEMT